MKLYKRVINSEMYLTQEGYHFIRFQRPKFEID